MHACGNTLDDPLNTKFIDLGFPVLSHQNWFEITISALDTSQWNLEEKKLSLRLNDLH